VVTVVAHRLKHFKATNIVLDPVMVATSGSVLLQSEAVSALREHLFSLATVLTPNIPEAEVLCGFDITSTAHMERAAQVIAQGINAAVLIKGGHVVTREDDSSSLPPTARDILYGNSRNVQNNRSGHSSDAQRDNDAPISNGGSYHWFEAPYINNPNTHGTGCTLSSAIACNLADGHSLKESIFRAKNYLGEALAAQLNLGGGRGPLNHIPHWPKF
jgi:hydroxymethylpyrimidine/phosphomethylpyrimidine kinase